MNGDLRIGEAERDRAASVLGDHYAAGRLDHAEYSERLDAIWTARTRADLDLVFHDLPRLAPTMPTMPTAPPARQRGGLPWPVAALLVLVVGAVVLTHLPAVLLVVAAIVLLKVSRHRHRAARRQRWQEWQWQWRQFHGSQPDGRW